MNMDVDIAKMNECGTDIIRLVNEYREALNDLYTKIQHMPNQTQEWVGVSAERFARQLDIDRKMYEELANTVQSYADAMIIAANSIETTASGNRL